MDHYENILEEISYNGEKYKPDNKFNEFMNSDEFFAEIFKNVPVNKKPVPEEGGGGNTQEPVNQEEEKEEKDPLPEPPEKELTPEPVPTEPEEDKTSGRERIIKKYIRKCYKVIVLKCHPDKNKSEESNKSNKQFQKCQEYYDSELLIGLLYVFYLYKLKPPAPLNIATPTVPDMDCSIIIDRIIREIRVIQDKLEIFNKPIEPKEEPKPEPE